MERLQFATLNNVCAERAIASASFDRALKYSLCAQQLISPDLEEISDNADLARSLYLNLVVGYYRYTAWTSNC
jgi:hypothetical protein